jgi:hypothetical protein
MIEAIRSSETSVITREIRGITSQKTAFFIVTAVKTTNNTEHYPAGICSGDVMCFLRGTNWVFIFQETALFMVTSVRTSKLTEHERAGLCSDVMYLRYELDFYIPEDGILHSHHNN